jgi:cysteine-rich repeat protein
MSPYGRVLVGCVCVSVTTLVAVPSAWAAADTYRFRDKLESDQGGAAGNVLVPTFNNGTAVAGTYVDTVVDANACANIPTVRGYSFPAFGGLRSANDKPIVVGEAYTISMIVKFAPLRSGYTRLIDFSNSTLDDGIYILNQGISFYPVGTYAPGSFVDDRFSVMTLTRDSATSVVSLFIGLTAAGTYTDTTKKYVPSAGNMHFFMDNTTGAAAVSESSPGIVTFLRVSDQTTTSETLAKTIADACEAVACGNGKREGAEGCDDGNNVDGDGCSSTCKIENGLACGNPLDGGVGDAGDAGTTGDTCQSGVCDSRDSKCAYANGEGSTCDTTSAAVVCRSKTCGTASKKCIPNGGCFVAGDCTSSGDSCTAATFACGSAPPADAAAPDDASVPSPGPRDAGSGGSSALDAGDLNLLGNGAGDPSCSCFAGPRTTSLPALGVSLWATFIAVVRWRTRRRRRS